MTPRLIYLFEVQPVDDGGVVQEQRWAAGGRILQTYAGVRWMSCVVNAAGSDGPFTYTAGFPLNSTDGIGGAARAGFGSLTLARHKSRRGAPRDLSHLLALHFDGHPITIRRGPDGEDFGNFTTLLRGVMGMPSFGTAQVTIPLRDLAVVVDVPAQPQTYAGTGQYEGFPEKKGLRKPLVLGRALNLEPEILDHAAPGAPPPPPPPGETAPLTYSRVVQLHDGPVQSALLAFYERLLHFDPATVHVVPDVYAWTPIAGHIAVDPNGGYARFGAVPEGLITVDVDSNAGGSTHADVVLRLLVGSGCATPFDIDAAAMQAFEAEVPAGRTSMVIRDDRTVAAVLEVLAQSAGAYWTFTPRRKFRMRQIGWSTSKGVLSGAKIVDLRPIQAEPPVWRYRFGALPMERVVTDTDVGSADAIPSVRAARMQAYVYTTHEDAPTKARHPLAKELTRDSRFTDMTAALFEGIRQSRLLKYPRQPFAVTVRVPYETCDLGDTWTIQYPDYGLQAGRDFIVREKTERPAYRRNKDMVELTLFGPRAVGE